MKATMDLQIVDPLAWVRRNEARFFQAGRVEAMLLLPYVMSDVLEIGRGECRISFHDSWWVIASDADWLVHPEHSVTELFQHVVPAIEHGAHSLRGEILIAAFASDVFTRGGGQEHVIVGRGPELSLLDRAVDRDWCRRLIAFRLRQPEEVA